MRLLIAAMVFVFLPAGLRAQDEPATADTRSDAQEFLDRHLGRPIGGLGGLTEVAYVDVGVPKWPDTIYYDTPYDGGLLGSATIPITFNRLFLKDGEAQVGAAISAGYGYTWAFGEFTIQEDGSIRVDPAFVFGVAGDASLLNDGDGSLDTGLTAGLFAGIKAITLFGGYDFLNSSFSVGLGTRFDFFEWDDDNFRPWGTVRPVRNPEPDAEPVRRAQ